MSADPDNAGASADNPQSWNAYSYVLDNPINRLDPDGRDPCDNDPNQCISVTAFADTFPVIDVNIVGQVHQAAQKSYDYLRTAWDFWRTASNASCVAAYTAAGTAAGTIAGGGIGTWAGGALGAGAGVAEAAPSGEALSPVTVPLSAAGGAALGGPVGANIGAPAGGALGWLYGQTVCRTGNGGGGGSGGASGGSGKGGSFWKGLKNYRGNIKTNGLSGKAKRFYQWDNTHGEVEVYNSRGEHLGAADPETGNMIKAAVPGRSLEL